MNLHPVLPWLTGAAVLLAAGRGQANDSAMGGHGGSLVPLSETRVRMVSEDIELRYDDGQWDVTAHYVFRNTTDAPVALRMGFPETHCEGEGDCVMGEGDVFENMRTRVRGKPVPRKKGKLDRKHAWAPKLGMVWLYDVRFDAGEQLEIDHSYTTPSGIDVMGTSFTTYVTRTGALWGGPIERATFRVVLPASARQVREPSALPRVKAERLDDEDGALALTYEVRDWTPQGDFHIGFSERVDWLGLEPQGPLKDLRCDGLFSLYLVAETEDGRAADHLDLPADLPDLRICRNAVYAQHGRRFEDEALNQYFYGSEGFAPEGPAVLAFDPNPAYSDALLTREDRKVLAMIVARERALGGPRTQPRSAAGGNKGREPVGPAPHAAQATAAPKAAPAAKPRAGAGCGGCRVGPSALPEAALWSFWLLYMARRWRC